jgi:hypothetical protein
LAANELFEFGDADLILIVEPFGLEDSRQAIEDGGFPMSEELGLDVVLATEFGLADFAAQQFENEPSFEVGGKGPTSAWHERVSWHDPVRVRLLVQRQGRTTHHQQVGQDCKG